MTTRWDFDESENVQVVEEQRQAEFERVYGPLDTRLKQWMGERVVVKQRDGYIGAEVLWVAAAQKAHDGIPDLPRRFIVQIAGNRFPTILYSDEVMLIR